MVYTTLATELLETRWSRNEGGSHLVLERTDSIQNFFIVPKSDLSQSKIKINIINVINKCNKCIYSHYFYFLYYWIFKCMVQ